jgi:DNA-binding MarR family transcriptional regulator
MDAVVPPQAAVPFARLFAMAYRQLIDQLHERLRLRGWTDVRPADGFALLAAREKPVTTTALAALMGMTKQAASKLAADLVAAGYLVQVVEREDARVRPLRLTATGARLLATVEEIYAELESEWADLLGRRRLEGLRADLTRAVTTSTGELPAIRPPW